MRVELEDLDVGDEILVPVISDFRRFKVLRKPKESIRKPSCYVAVKCEFYNKNLNGSYREYDVTKDDFNDTHYFDLNYKMLWLIKKGEK